MIRKKIGSRVTMLSILTGITAVTTSASTYAFNTPVTLALGAVEIMTELRQALDSKDIDKANEILDSAQKELSDPDAMRYDIDDFDAPEGKTDPNTL